jgi:hypothetical protein
MIQKKINQTSTLNKILYAFNYGVFSLSLELVNANRQMHSDHDSEYDEFFKFSFDNFRWFFGPAGLFLDTLFFLFPKFTKFLSKENCNKKIYNGFFKTGIFVVILLGIILLRYVLEKILEKYQKNIAVKVLLGGVISFGLIFLKMCLKTIIRSIVEFDKAENPTDEEKNQKNKLILKIAILLLTISVLCLYLNLLIQRNLVFANHLLAKAFITGMLSFFSYSVLFELLVYNIVFIKLSIEDKQSKIKSKLAFLTKEKAGKELNLFGKVVYLGLLISLIVLATWLFFLIDKTFEFYNNFEIGGLKEFALLNAKEITSFIPSIFLIYGLSYLSDTINEIIEDIFMKEQVENGKENKNNFGKIAILYFALASISAFLNVAIGVSIMLKMMNFENDLTKYFGFEKKFFTPLIIGIFVFTSICNGLISCIAGHLCEKADFINAQPDKSADNKFILFFANVFESSDKELLGT